MKKLSKIQSGVTGVYLTAGELTKQGYITSITFRNTKDIDILASNEDGTKTVNIQVKTNQGNKNKWLLSEKSESYFSDIFFYIFVNLNNGNQPDFFVVPSKDLASFIKDNHEKWMAKLGLKGQKHKATSLRAFVDKEKQYLNRWDLLGFEKV